MQLLTARFAIDTPCLGVHQSGRFVIVSNRGHESITIFRVKQGCGGGVGGKGAKGHAMRGTLAQVGFFHTRGETPRHFQFDHSGQFLIVANQDSDTIAVFSFNLTSGEIKYTGNEVREKHVADYVLHLLLLRCTDFHFSRCSVPCPQPELYLLLPNGRQVL